VLVVLVERGETASTRGLGRKAKLAGEDSEVPPLDGTWVDFEGVVEDMTESSLKLSFQAGGEGAWKRSWPLSSARFAV
jgi:hypothetical protein